MPWVLAAFSFQAAGGSFAAPPGPFGIPGDGGPARVGSSIRLAAIPEQAISATIARKVSAKALR